MSGAGMIVVGLAIFLALAVQWGHDWRDTARFMRVAKLITGHVRTVDLIYKRSTWVYVEFEVDGVPINFGELSAHGYFLHEGDSVSVYYDPCDPSQAKIGPAFRIWFYKLDMCWLALIFVIAGLFHRDRRV